MSRRPSWILLLCVLMLVLSACGKRLERIKTDAGPGSMAMDSRGHYLFVACEGSSTLLAWDLFKRRLAARVKLGKSPLRVYYDTESRAVRVLCAGSKRMLTFSVPALKPLGSLSLPAGPVAWAADLERHRDLFCSPVNNKINVYLGNNPMPAIEAGVDPVDLAVPKGTDMVWAANFRSHDLTVVNLRTGQVVQAVKVRMNPIKFRMSLLGETLYVLCRGNDAFPPESVVQMVDLPNQRAGLTYSAGAGARDFVIDSLGKVLYVIAPDGIHAINLLTDAKVSFPTGKDPRAVLVSPDGSRVYVSCFQDQAVVVHRVDKWFK